MLYSGRKGCLPVTCIFLHLISAPVERKYKEIHHKAEHHDTDSGVLNRSVNKLENDFEYQLQGIYD